MIHIIFIRYILKFVARIRPETLNKICKNMISQFGGGTQTERF